MEYDAHGMETRRKVLGDEHVDRAVRSTSAFTEEFQRFITKYAWGSVWSRPELDLKTRSCITVALLTALRAEHELVLHARAAIRNGVTREELSEVLLHTGIYAGLPPANRAFSLINDAFAADDALAEDSENS